MSDLSCRTGLSQRVRHHHWCKGPVGTKGRVQLPVQWKQLEQYRWHTSTDIDDSLLHTANPHLLPGLYDFCIAAQAICFRLGGFVVI